MSCVARLLAMPWRMNLASATVTSMGYNGKHGRENAKRIAAMVLVSAVVALGILASFGAPIPLLSGPDNLYLAIWEFLSR